MSHNSRSIFLSHDPEEQYDHLGDAEDDEIQNRFCKPWRMTSEKFGSWVIELITSLTMVPPPLILPRFPPGATA